jgi:hypothetical protein
MFLTTEAVVADKPEPAGAGGHGWNGRHDVSRALKPCYINVFKDI